MNTISPKTCFWSLLSQDDFRFLCVPSSIGKIRITPDGQTIKNVLLNRSLFEIMHPIEIDLAKADLTRFLKLKVLAGSVTRCRLLAIDDLTTYLSSKPSQPPLFYQQNCNEDRINSMRWNITDLVMYTVTEGTVLAFFHNYDLDSFYLNKDVRYKPNCDHLCQCFLQEDVVELTNVLSQQRMAQKKLRSRNEEEGVHIFQVIDRLTKQPILTWPQPQQVSFIETILIKTNHIALQEFNNISFSTPYQPYHGTNCMDNISCSRHFYAKSKIDIFDTLSNFQRMLIPYGNIIFESFHISIATPFSPVNRPSYSSPFLSSGVSLSRQPHDTIVETTCRSKSIDDGDLTLSQSRQPLEYRDSIFTDTSTVNTIEAEKNHILHSNHEVKSAPESSWLERDTYMIYQPQDTTEGHHLQSGSSMFQKFRIQRLEENIVQPNSNYTAVKMHRNTFFNIKSSEGELSPRHTKFCASCHTSNSPEWRRGPDGHKTLCNACGLRYSRFKSKQWTTASKTFSKQ